MNSYYFKKNNQSKTKKTRVLFLLLSLFLIISCADKQNSNGATDGVWQSVGYGRLVKISEGEFLLADVTDISCIPIMSGNISDFGEDRVKVLNDTLILTEGINNYAFVRITDAPKTCKEGLTEEQKKDPIFNFNVLANTFEKHYAYFKERNIDWDTLKMSYKSKITPETTDAELFKFMKEMLDSFKDGHIGLDAPQNIEKAAAELMKDENIATQPKLKSYNRKQLSDAIANAYIKNGKSKHNKFIRWGILPDSIGYLQVNQMMGYANYGVSDTLSRRDYYMAYFEKAGESINTTADELEGFIPTIDEVMKDLKQTKTMIIDVRFNGGGEDMIGLELMSRFNTKQRPVFTKKAKFGETYTKENLILLKSDHNPYTKPVYILIGDGSASATEIMTLSSLPLDHITRIGSHTNGVFSDVLEKTLPNGWDFGLSNEVYLDTQGNNYEGIGIAPDIDLGYAKDRQVQFRTIMKSLSNNNGDDAIERVRELIRKNRP